MSLDQEPEFTAAQVAQMYGISEHTVHAARKIRREGIAELVEELFSAKLTIDQATQLLEYSHEEQREAVRCIRSHEVENYSKLLLRHEPKSSRISFIHAWTRVLKTECEKLMSNLLSTAGQWANRKFD